MGRKILGRFGRQCPKPKPGSLGLVLALLWPLCFVLSSSLPRAVGQMCQDPFEQWEHAGPQGQGANSLTASMVLFPAGLCPLQRIKKPGWTTIPFCLPSAMGFCCICSMQCEKFQHVCHPRIITLVGGETSQFHPLHGCPPTAPWPWAALGMGHPWVSMGCTQSAMVSSSCALRKALRGDPFPSELCVASLQP